MLVPLASVGIFEVSTSTDSRRKKILGSEYHRVNPGCMAYEWHKPLLNLLNGDNSSRYPTGLLEGLSFKCVKCLKWCPALISIWSC